MSGKGGLREDRENRLARWSRLKRKRAAGESVHDTDAPGGEATDHGAHASVEPGAAPRGAAAPRFEPDGTDQMAMVNGKPYMPPLADPEGADVDYDDPTGGMAGAPGMLPPTHGAWVEDEEPELTPEEAEAIKDLPTIEELDGDSDFTGFLNKKVPEFIRRKALRKLWLSDPAFSFLDGMNEYDEDYSVVAELVAGASDYRPGEGGYSWKDKPVEAKADEAVAGDPAAADSAQRGSAPRSAEAGESAESDRQDSAETEGSERSVDQADDHEMSLAEKTRLVQNRGGSSVRAPEYTSNPYYQAPSVRDPIPAEFASVETVRSIANDTSDVDEDDELGDAEDDLG